MSRHPSSPPTLHSTLYYAYPIGVGSKYPCTAEPLWGGGGGGLLGRPTRAFLGARARASWPPGGSRRAVLAGVVSVMSCSRGPPMGAAAAAASSSSSPRRVASRCAPAHERGALQPSRARAGPAAPPASSLQRAVGRRVTTTARQPAAPSSWRRTTHAAGAIRPFVGIKILESISSQRRPGPVRELTSKLY
eukprot:scaffold4902_cov377-Prasinococcus_capsulatus_cf.AAC.5